MKIKSLGLKTSLIVAVMIAATVVAIVYIVSTQSDALVTEITAVSAKSANKAFVTEVETLLEEAASRAVIIGSSGDIINAILVGNDSALKKTLTDLSSGIDIITLCDTDGYVLSRMHSDQKGDNVLNQRAISAALNTGKGIVAIERGSTMGLSTRASAAVRDYDGNIIGAVTCGHDLSNPKYVDLVKEGNSCEATVFDGDTRLMTTIIDEKGNRVIGTKASDEVVELVINQRRDFSKPVVLFGSNYFAYYSPIISDNDVIGMLFTGVNIDSALAGQKSMMNMVIIAGVICGLACLLFVIVFTTFSVSKPLKKIGAYAEKIRSGDIGVSSATTAVIDVRSSDEVGVLARALEQAYMQLQGYVKEIQERMQGLAEGDLTTESTYSFSGDFVLIKDSINDIVKNLNRIMTEVNNTSAQVSSGAKQVADGSQSLAQGSTEQAATVQHLSSAISDIALKTKDNSDMAGRAAALGATIMQSAEKGSRQMDEMMAAVKDINVASNSISKVIKVIDDIAFQTNILALNAAVEAARAGQHGKGFAVVAEEVRSLAAKSAEAAKDTGGLIANSMEKAGLGAKIAGDTATSLAEIVSGINESSLLVNEIARSSEEQNAGISQINTGIDQVAQVTQQNSATAEQSAAASEEMSSQSTILEDLISQFRLKDGANMKRSLPSAKKPARGSHSQTDSQGFDYW